MRLTKLLHIVHQIIVFVKLVKSAEQNAFNNSVKTNQNVKENSYEDVSYTNLFRDSMNEQSWAETKNRIRHHAKIGALPLTCN